VRARRTVVKTENNTAVFAIVLIAACASSPRRPIPPFPPTPATPAAELSSAPDYATEYQRAWFDVAAKIKLGQLKDAYYLGLDLIGSINFQDLIAADQHQKLFVIGKLGVKLRDYTFGHRLLVRASEMPEGNALDWVARMDAASRLGEHADVVHGLTVIARRWPNTLSNLNYEFVEETATQTSGTDKEDKARFELLNALYDASWKDENGLEPGALWGSLIRELLVRGDAARALEVTSRENNPTEIIILRVDKRFDAFVRGNTISFDIAAAAQRQIIECQGAVKRNSRSLAAVVALLDAYLDAGLYNEVYRLTSSILKKISASQRPKDFYDDAETMMASIFDRKSEALNDLQRWKEAGDEERRAAEQLQDGGPDIGNIINLAYYYAELGSGDKALNTLDRLSGSTPSPYGQMQVERVRLMAGVAKHDENIVRDSLAYLKEHQKDSLTTFQRGLVWANKMDEAAKLLIERLRDPRLRADALAEIQQYSGPPLPRFATTFRIRWEKVIARGDVNTEIHRVGRIERVPVPSRL
jgi:tetratricopeptide (TPR) repeat protein